MPCGCTYSPADPCQWCRDDPNQRADLDGTHKARTDSAPANPDLHKLAAAQRRVDVHEQATRQARDHRDRMIARLRDAGVPWKDLSDVTGLTPRGLLKQMKATER